MISEYDIVLDCNGCGKTFKITLERGRIVDAIPCPSCKTRDLIAFEDEEKDATDLKDFFQRSHTPRVLDRLDVLTAGISSEVAPKAQRRFRNVVHVHVDKSSLDKKVDLVPKPDIPKPQAVVRSPESPSPQIGNLSKAELRKNLKQHLQKSPPKPAPEAQPENIQEAFTKVVKDRVQDALPSPPDLPSADLLEPLFLAQKPFDPEALELGIELKHDEEKVLFDKIQLKKLIRSQVWLGGFEADLNGVWVKFLDHPAYELLKEELKREAKERLVAITLDLDRQESHSPDIISEDTPSVALQERGLPEKNNTIAEIENDGPSPEQSKPQYSKLIYLLPLFLIGVAILYFYAAPEKKEDIQPAIVVPIVPPRSAILAGEYIFSRAKTMVLLASSIRQESRKDLLRKSGKALEKSNFGEALDYLYELKRRNPDDRDVIEKLIHANLGRAKFREAREEIVKLVSLEGESKMSKALYSESLRRDMNLRPKIIDIDTLDIDAIKALGGGKSISFKFKKKGKNVYAFKPAQFEWNAGWEGEVAAYRFCEIATCGFRIPRSQSSKISRKNFTALYAMNTADQKSYANRFKDLIWKSETVNGKKVDYLYGVLKEWVPHMVDWPIEYTQIWAKWLDPNQPIQTKVAVLPELDLLRQKNRLIWRRLRKEMNVPLGRVAGELSNLLSFDYLVNNWDRFSEKEDFYGVNNQFANGHFLSLDNGAAFGLRHSRRVEKRFSLVGRFSKRFVASLYLCDHRIDEYLFPSRSKIAKKKLIFFHERRLALLNIISEKLKNDEESNILRFD